MAERFTAQPIAVDLLATFNTPKEYASNSLSTTGAKVVGLRLAMHWQVRPTVTDCKASTNGASDQVI